MPGTTVLRHHVSISRSCDAITNWSGGRTALSLGNGILRVGRGAFEADAQHARRASERRASVEASADRAAEEHLACAAHVLRTAAARRDWCRLVMAPFPRWLVANLWRNGVRELFAPFEGIEEANRFTDAMYACAAGPAVRAEDARVLLFRKCASKTTTDWAEPYTGTFEVVYVLDELISRVTVHFEPDLMPEVERRLLDAATWAPLLTDADGDTRPRNVLSITEACEACGKPNISLLYSLRSPALARLDARARRALCRCRVCGARGRLKA